MGVGFDGGGDEVEDAAALLAAGFDYGQHRFHETAARTRKAGTRLCVPNDNLRQITKCRRERSARLLVGSTPA